MTCDEQRALIGPYIDDDLPAEARRRVEAHLLACRECAWDAQTLAIARGRLRDGLGEVVASDAFRARVLHRLTADNPHLVTTEPTAEEPTQYQLPITL